MKIFNCRTSSSSEHNFYNVNFLSFAGMLPITPTTGDHLCEGVTVLPGAAILDKFVAQTSHVPILVLQPFDGNGRYYGIVLMPSQQHSTLATTLQVTGFGGCDQSLIFWMNSFCLSWTPTRHSCRQIREHYVPSKQARHSLKAYKLWSRDEPVAVYNTAFKMFPVNLKTRDMGSSAVGTV